MGFEGEWLKQRGVMTVEQLVEFVLQALEAMANAHVQGIIHRDLKRRTCSVCAAETGYR